MSFQRKADELVRQAKAIAREVTTWADFATLVFGQKDGLIARAFTDDVERQLFYDSPEYKQLSAMRLELIKKTGVVRGGTPEKSGRLLVRLPKTVHMAIDVEAKREGVSINQLVVSKLSVPLRHHVDLSIPTIVEAYSRVFEGYSTDRVVVDPELNAKFLTECRKLGVAGSDYSVNHVLLDIRKSKKVELPRATKRTEFRDYDAYQFASEIAVRLLQRSEGASLDRILCDPALAFRFDEIASQIAPHEPPLKLRWAALNLRKTRRLGPKPMTLADDIDLIPAGPFRLLRPSDLPRAPGVYSLFDRNRPLFAGETLDLQQRVRLHLEGKMPNWVELTEDAECILKYSPMPAANSKERASWLCRFINQQRPLLNYQRAA